MADSFSPLPVVVDCLGKDFDDACAALARRVRLSSEPDLWLGIEAGGAYIVERMRSLGVVDARCESIKASRPSTRHKQGAELSQVFRWMPKEVANVARVGEHLMRQWRFEKTRQPVRRDVSVSPETAAAIETAKKIVVIDDAIDSGSSVVQVVDAIRRINPHCSIEVAVIVQTFRRPLRRPDHVLLLNALLRFPWSADAK